MPGLPFMDQWQRDEIAKAERLDAEYLARQEALRREWADKIAQVPDDDNRAPTMLVWLLAVLVALVAWMAGPVVLALMTGVFG